MIVLHSNATGLKSPFADIDDLESYMDDYRVVERREADGFTAYTVEPTAFRGVANLITVDRDEHEALLLMDDMTLDR